MAATKTAIILLFFLPLLQPLKQASSTSNLVQTTCRSTPYPELCISRISSKKPSSSTDVRGLALIIVDILTSEIHNTMEEIGRIKAENSGVEMKRALGSCSRAYSDALKWFIPETSQALTYGDPKFAVDGATGVGGEADSCDEFLSRVKSPLSFYNKMIRELSLVAAAISRQLL